MYQELLSDVSFYVALLKLDEEVAAEWRQRRCACGGRLDAANYPRKPRGCPLWPEAAFRFSFCCSVEGCRRRSTPPSVRFLGRRVFFGAVVIVAGFLLGGRSSIASVCRELGVSRKTLLRWRRWWCRTFPRTPVYLQLSGRIVPPPEARSLPGSLLERFTGGSFDRLQRVLEVLKPLSI